MEKLDLIKRTNPQGLRNCCFIFDSRNAFFRVYSEDRKTFTDYDIANCVTPFISFANSNDVELKEFRREDGSIYRLMDFPESILSCKQSPPLNPGETWIKDS